MEKKIMDFCLDAYEKEAIARLVRLVGKGQYTANDIVSMVNVIQWEAEQSKWDLTLRMQALTQG